MDWLLVLLAALVGYLLGSIPVGLLVTRLYGVDIRKVGSGRTGGTNAWRAAGLKAAIPTVLGDALKGAVAVILVRALAPALFGDANGAVTALAAALAGGAAVVGHNWSIFLGFAGGAGGMTTAATVMVLSPLVGGIVWITGILLIWWSRMASVGTFAVGATSLATLLIFAITGTGETPWPYALFGVIVFLSITISLRRNRQQLREGRERVITLW